jgi:hypothetical protein
MILMLAPVVQWLSVCFWFAISDAMILVCDAPCQAVLLGSFTNPFANSFTRIGA